MSTAISKHFSTDFNVEAGTDRELFPDPSIALIALVEEQSHYRPRPLRAFDQIHMRPEDAARQIELLGRLTEGKRVLFMGDSDGLALGLISAAHRRLVPSPRSVTLCDFDERVLRFAQSGTRAVGCAPVKTVRYNVFDPVPAELLAAFDFFHTNPPYGMYNAGRSIIAFTMRCIAALRPDGEGIVVLANDPRREWTVDVLRTVSLYLRETGVQSTATLQRVHRYVLDDDPELESGIIFCRLGAPQRAPGENLPLPPCYAESFYGRESIRIPAYINRFGAAVYSNK